MLIPEYQGDCQTTYGETIITIESHCPDDCGESILEALVRLIKREVAGLEAYDE